MCLSSRGAKCCPCWLLVGSNERRHTKWYFSLSCLEQVPAESFGSCWVLCSGNFCSTECWSHCRSWMTPDPLVTMSLTRRSEGVKTRWNPSSALLQGRKHLLTSRAAARSIWGACRAQNDFKRPQIHLEDRFHGPRVRILTVHHSAPKQPLFFHLCYSSQPQPGHLSLLRLGESCVSPPHSQHCPKALERQLAVRGWGSWQRCGMRCEARETRELTGLVSPVTTCRTIVPVPQQMGQHLIFIPKESNKWQGRLLSAEKNKSNAN